MAEYRIFQLRLNCESDATRISWLERQENATQAIRSLVDGAMVGTGANVSTSQIDATQIAQIVRATMISVFDEKTPGAIVTTTTPDTTNDLENELGADCDAMMGSWD